MRLRAKFGDVVLDVETENEDRAVALYGYWLSIVNKILTDDSTPASCKVMRETQH